MRLLSLLYLLLALPTYAETLTIAIPPFNPPFVMNADNNNHYIGFSIEIMSAICKRMQVTCKYKPLGFNETFDEVMSRKVDLGIGNFTITPEREQYVLFSLPYLQSQAAILALSSSPLTSFDDLRGKTVGAEKDTIFGGFLEKRFDNTVQIKPFPIVSELIFALNNGGVDAVILDRETALFWVGNNGDLFKLVVPSISIGSGIGMMTNKENTALMARINKSLEAIQTEGVYLKIYNTYFGDMSLI